MAMEDLRIMGRATQGVRLIKLDESDVIAAVAKVAKMKEEEIEGELPEDEAGQALPDDSEA
jgi:DNA gyrase subunit A